MRFLFPFVPRSLYEAREFAHAQERAELLAIIESERRRSEHLTDTIIDMKVSGGSVARAAAATAGVAFRATKPERSLWQQAIDENKYASSNPRLRAHLTAWAEKEVTAHMAAPGAEREQVEREIANKLRSWSVMSDADDDDDEDDVIELEAEK